MKHNRQKLYQNRCLTREFLFSKTDSKQHGKKAGRAYPDPGEFKLGELKPDELKKEFPDLLFDSSFIERAMNRLDSLSQFGAMVIQIDDFSYQQDETESDHVTTDILIDAARIIDAECKNKNGIWGQIDGNIFGCFFPEASDAVCRELADKTREKLAELRDETISIGIASYPTLNYKKADILENARKALKHAEFFGPGSTVKFDSVSLNISGDWLYQEGDINEAIEEFKLAVLLDPSNVNVHNSLGVCYGVLGAYEKALEHFKEALGLDAAEVMALYNAGLVNILMNNKDEALECLIEADSTGDDIFEVAFHAGKLFFDKGKFKEGRRFLEKAVQLKPKSGAAYRYLGECYMAEHMTDEAVSAYKKAIKNNPNDAASLSALGYLFDVQGENPEITAIFCQQSIDIEPENGMFRNRLARLYLKQNQLKEALTEFEKAHDLGYDSMEFIEKIQDMVQDEQNK